MVQKKQETINTNLETDKCPTCTRTFQTQRNCNRHRAQGENCRQQWEQDRKTYKKCTYEKCGKSFTTSEQLQSYLHQHKLTQKNTKLYTLNPEGHIDRRKMIYHSEPAQEITQARKIIKYNPTAQLWECQKCTKTATKQNKRSLIQHANISHKKANSTTTQITEQTPREKEIMQIRIRTLQQKEAIQTYTTPEEAQTKNIKNKTAEQQRRDTFWERIGMVKKNKNQTYWECQIEECVEKPKNKASIGQHIAKNTLITH